MKLGHWPKLQKLHIYIVLSFYPRGLRLRLFSLYGQLFPRYCPIFKIDIFRHETWPLAKGTEVAHMLFLAQGVKIELIFDLHCTWSSFRDTGNFQHCHNLGMKLGHWPKFQKLHIQAVYPGGGGGVKIELTGIFALWAAVSKIRAQGVEIALIFALRAAVSEIRTDLQNCNIWA